MVGMKFKRGLILLVLLSVISFSAFAKDPQRILSNSEDWRDVYSVMLYSNLIGKHGSFLVSDKHATLILNSIPKENHIWAFSSKKIPQVMAYRNILESKGYSAEEFISDNLNLEIAKRLDKVKKFIIIDDSYGYNAISVAPYAVVTNSYVLFADKTSIKNVLAFLNERKAEKPIIYGNVDREVKSALAKFNPETINKDGDRFLNNIEIVKKYQGLRHSKQAVLTNGEFIEGEIMSGTEPVVFIGTNNVPDAIQQYVKGSEIDVGVLIGNELVGTATFIRRQMGISVFVKFAQGARNPQGAISQVEALDMFYLPTYPLTLEIQSIKYNRATNKLEVTLKNAGLQAIYFIGTYGITAQDGTKLTVGDIGANFIDGNEAKTLTYDAENLPDGDLDIDVFIIYGESKGSLEKEIRKTVKAQSVRVLDQCEIEVHDISYSSSKQQFYATIENTGDVDCFVDLEIIDFVVAGEKKTYTLESVAELASGSTKSLRIKAEDIEEEDLPDNENVRLRAYYGEREDTLFKVKDLTLALVLKKFEIMSYALWIVIVLLLFLIIWKRRKKKKEEENEV